MTHWRHYLTQIIAAEINSIARYSDQFIQTEIRENHTQAIFDQIQNGNKKTVQKLTQIESLRSEPQTLIFLNGTFNHCLDIQSLLEGLYTKLKREDRLVVLTYNPYLNFLYTWANKLGIRKGELPVTFLTRTDLNNICKLSGFEVVGERHLGFCPWPLLGLGTLLNRVLPALPGLCQLSLASLFCIRPIKASPAESKPSLSIVIPCRNEKGNIENAITRMPRFPAPIELIFVEGNSTDDTWEEIQRIQKKYGDQYTIRVAKQPGKGKNDAVRLGFSLASNDLLTILDADLTMPPEKLIKFYDAYTSGKADFVNGSRLVYPMEGEAMRFLNKLGNVFFAKSLSFVLGVRLGDSLCGTKLVSRRDYQKFIQWRRDFGDFDPFGDFELLFPAAILGKGIIDIPIRYLARTYGSTNISRFRHGFILLKMTLIGLFKIKWGKIDSRAFEARTATNLEREPQPNLPST